MKYRRHSSTSGTETWDFGRVVKIHGVLMSFNWVPASPCYIYMNGDLGTSGGAIATGFIDSATMTQDKRFIHLFYPYPIETKSLHIYDPNSACNATILYED